jgi:phenylpropionate dioxygenase-like ring-hydroxylating dioxygenase large terminal subunit
MTYVRNAWYVAAWTHEVAPDRPVGVRILNEPIVLWRNVAAELAAFDDRCVHRLAPLSLGRCEGENLRCMYHGLLYDRTGRVVEIPGQDRIPSSLRVRNYPVVERHSWIWVWMGDAAAADEGLIPPVVGMDRGHTDYVFAHGTLDYAAEGQLIFDNLLDLSHVSFLHTESFRLGETWARERPKVTEHDRGIRSERWFRNEGPNGAVDAEELVDSYFCYDCFVPGVLLMTLRTYPVGSADALNGHPPDVTQPARTFTSQAVTPLTDKTARYFYVVAGRRRGAETEYDMTDYEKGFAEDKTMIEAQQRNIDVTPGWRFMPTTADRGIILFNRLVEKLWREERSQSREASPPASAQQ